MVPAATGDAQEAAEALKPCEEPVAEMQSRVLVLHPDGSSHAGKTGRAEARGGVAREKLGGTGIRAARALRTSCRVGGEVALDVEEMRRIRLARFGADEPSPSACADCFRDGCLAGSADCTSPRRPQTVA